MDSGGASTECCPDKITLNDIQAAVARYNASSPHNLEHLNEQRYNIIPAAMLQCRPFTDANAIQTGNPERHLKKDELITLMEWKLKHGTYRPRLLSLIKSNPETLVEEATAAAFKALTPQSQAAGSLFVSDRSPQEEQHVDIIPNTKSVLEAITILGTLKGVGPATASLILSVGLPRSIPFFSDELIQWVSITATGAGPVSEKKPNALKDSKRRRQLRYDKNEYRYLFERVTEIRSKHANTFSCTLLEKAAWVFLHEAQGRDRRTADFESKHDRSKPHRQAKRTHVAEELPDSKRPRTRSRRFES